MFEFMTVRGPYKITMSGFHAEQGSVEYVQLQGWVRTNCCSGRFGFIELSDGTYFRNTQLAYLQELRSFVEVEKYPTGVAIIVTGRFVSISQGKQPFEIQVIEALSGGDCDRDYPLQKKRYSFEYLCEIAHLRPHANSPYAIFRLRSVLSMAIHESFQGQGFVYIHIPIITGSDGKGAGEMLRATTGDDADYEQDFFRGEALLVVTEQLHVEVFAMASRDVYILGPVFHAENSNMGHHVSEFWMAESEIAFVDLEDDMSLIEDTVRYCTDYVPENAPEGTKFFNMMIGKSCIEHITKVRNLDFKWMTYTEVVDLLLQADVKFNNKVEWGIDSNPEHERYICEKIVGGSVFLVDYLREIKTFYVRVSDDGKTVTACDLLALGAGELVGGDQHEERYDVLGACVKDMGMMTDSLQWYMDLRRYKDCKHTDFGLGFDRLLMYLTKMQNIRDAEPFPRISKNSSF